MSERLADGVDQTYPILDSLGGTQQATIVSEAGIPHPTPTTGVRDQRGPPPDAKQRWARQVSRCATPATKARGVGDDAIERRVEQLRQFRRWITTEGAGVHSLDTCCIWGWSGRCNGALHVAWAVAPAGSARSMCPPRARARKVRNLRTFASHARAGARCNEPLHLSHSATPAERTGAAARSPATRARARASGGSSSGCCPRRAWAPGRSLRLSASRTAACASRSPLRWEPSSHLTSPSRWTPCAS